MKSRMLGTFIIFGTSSKHEVWAFAFALHQLVSDVCVWIIVLQVGGREKEECSVTI